MTLLLKPVTIATIAITVATPTTMPRVVSPERRLCSLMALTPKRTFSAKPLRKTSASLFIAVSLEPQGLDRSHARGGRGRGQAREHSRRHGHADAQDCETRLDPGRKDLVDQKGDRRAEQHSRDSSRAREQRSLEQELAANVPPPGAQGAAHAYLPGALDHRDEHDVCDHDRSDHQR